MTDVTVMEIPPVVAAAQRTPRRTYSRCRFSGSLLSCECAPGPRRHRGERFRAFEQVLSRCPRCGDRRNRRADRLPHWWAAAERPRTRHASGDGRANTGGAREQRPLLRVGRRDRRGARAPTGARRPSRGGSDDERRSEGPRDQRVFSRSRWDAARAHLVRELVRGAPTDPLRERGQRAHEPSDLLGLEARCAAEHLVALDLPRQRQRWRVVDQPRHEPDI